MDKNANKSGWGVFNQSSGEGAASADHLGGPQDIRYDFRRPNKFGKDQLRTLSIINENFAKTGSGFLSGYLRSSGELKVQSVEQCTYQEFMETISPPALLTMFQMSPLTGSAVLVLEHDFTAPALDLMFGGTGRRGNLAKPLTEIETRVLRKLVQKLLEEMADAWSNFYQYVPIIDTMESNAQFYKRASSMNEMVAVITFAASLADNQSLVYLCLPYPTMKEATINITAENLLLAQQPGSEPPNEHLVECLSRVSVDMEACCGQTRISVREFLQLEEGDVVLLNTIVGEDMELRVGGHPKFRVQPGNVGNQMAVMITDKI